MKHLGSKIKVNDNTLKVLLFNIWNEKALGLVEALVALAVVGTAMVLITQVSLRTIKQARRNELQDVAVQAAVEALDFMKQPGNIKVDGVKPDESYGQYYKLDLTANIPQIVYKERDMGANEIRECDFSSFYYNESLGSSGYYVCQQIFIQEVTSHKFDLKVIVVWQTVGGEYDKKVFEGFRVGTIGS